MADEKQNVRRVLHFRFALPSADPQHLLAMINSSAPLFEVFGSVSVRLLQNSDEPARFIQVIEYETPKDLESSRQRIASDPRVQAYLQIWRQTLGGAIDIEVYQDVGQAP
jgi:hypothetical protein